MRKRSLQNDIRCKGLGALAVACAAAVVSLAGAQAADAAFAWSGSNASAGTTSEQTAQRCRAGDDSAIASGGPCYYVALAMWGDGKVTSIMPTAVPGASTPAEQYPNGHIECPPASIWDCDFFFNWSFGDDTTVILQATTGAGETFLGWDLCPHVQGTNNRQCRIEQEDAVDCVEAHFAPNEPQISNCDAPPPPPPPPINVRVLKAGAGSGTVTSSPIGINCGATCQGTFGSNSTVTLTATPAAGSTFNGWTPTCTSGTCTCPTSGNTCSWMVLAGVERTVTATFGGTPPPPVWNTVILKKPAKITRSRTATFYWQAKRNGVNVSSFKSQCKLGKQAWVSCRNGKRYTNLKPGYHTFRVKVGNNGVWDKTPASYTWKIRR